MFPWCLLPDVMWASDLGHQCGMGCCHWHPGHLMPGQHLPPLAEEQHSLAVLRRAEERFRALHLHVLPARRSAPCHRCDSWEGSSPPRASVRLHRRRAHDGTPNIGLHMQGQPRVPCRSGASALEPFQSACKVRSVSMLMHRLSQRQQCLCHGKSDLEICSPRRALYE